MTGFVDLQSNCEEYWAVASHTWRDEKATMYETNCIRPAETAITELGEIAAKIETVLQSTDEKIKHYE